MRRSFRQIARPPCADCRLPRRRPPRLSRRRLGRRLSPLHDRLLRGRLRLPTRTPQAVARPAARAPARSRGCSRRAAAADTRTNCRDPRCLPLRLHVALFRRAARRRGGPAVPAAQSAQLSAPCGAAVAAIAKGGAARARRRCGDRYRSCAGCRSIRAEAASADRGTGNSEVLRRRSARVLRRRSARRRPYHRLPGPKRIEPVAAMLLEHGAAR